jgi:GT2 family glycosyltransferase
VKIVVIILALNQTESTLRCLKSLLVLQQPPFEVLLWDNGSTDGTAEAVREAFPRVIVHHHPINLGVASGRNAAAELAFDTFNPSHLLFLDNDMLVEPGFVRGLLRPFTEDEKVGQTQAKLRFMDDRLRINDGGGARINFSLWQVTPVGYGELDQGQYDLRKSCVSCGGAMMVRTEVFQELGGFDPKFDPFGPEDLDFSLRLRKAGYKAIYAPEAVAYHVVSHTFGKGYSPEYARKKSGHWYAFMRRHATTKQKVAFYSYGAPYIALRVLIREGRRGNFGALKALMQSLVDQFKALFVVG